jgi:hypothetical protein
MTVSRPDQVVEVFAPTGAPHLARIADDIQTQLRKQIEALPTDALRRLLRAGAEIEQRREEFERFRRRIGIK